MARDVISRPHRLLAVAVDPAKVFQPAELPRKDDRQLLLRDQVEQRARLVGADPRERFKVEAAQLRLVEPGRAPSHLLAQI